MLLGALWAVNSHSLNIGTVFKQVLTQTHSKVLSVHVVRLLRIQAQVDLICIVVKCTTCVIRFLV